MISFIGPPVTLPILWNIRNNEKRTAALTLVLNALTCLPFAAQ